MISLLSNLFRHAGKAIAKRQTQAALLFAALLLYSSTGYMYFELPKNPDLTWLDSIWWSMVTMTTVGYGDLFPTTMWGRVLVGFPTMLLGVGILGYMLSMVATAMLESKLLETKGMKNVVLTNHVLICGFGTLEKVLKLVQEIRKDIKTSEAEIVIVDDAIEELPPELRDSKVHFVRGDPAREVILHKASVETAQAVIVQANAADPEGSDNHNLKVVLTVESLCPSVLTVAECVNPENEVFFRRAHCDSVVCIASLAEQMLVQELQDPGVAQIVSELTSNSRGRQFYIVDLPQRDGTYADIHQLFAADDVILMGIRRGEEVFILPAPDFAIQQGDRAILVSSVRPTASPA
jgi:voltage-gated potassium channel